jgi:hypothetical protein
VKRLSGILATAISFWLPSICTAQNMVPNPSFETFSSAPTTFGLIANASPWGSAYGTCDLFHTSAATASVGIPTNYFGSQATHSGNAYAGIAWSNTNSYHEYLRVPLTGPLTIGQAYYCEAYVSAGEGAYRYGTNNFGFLLTTTAMSGGAGDPPISSVPQVNWTTPITDYTNWTLVSGTFVATAAAQHLTLGSFNSVASTTWVLLGTSGSINSMYWYIDDVVVQPTTVLPLQLSSLSLYPAPKGGVQVNWTVNPGDASLFAVERSIDGGEHWVLAGQWPAKGQASFETIDNPMVYQTTLLYRIKQVDADGTVTRSQPKSILLEAPSLESSLALAPNPIAAGEESWVSWASNMAGITHLTLTNLLGKVEWEVTFESEAGFHQVALPTGELPQGTHLLIVESGGERVVRKWILQQ